MLEAGSKCSIANSQKNATILQGTSWCYINLIVTQINLPTRYVSYVRKIFETTKACVNYVQALLSGHQLLFIKRSAPGLAPSFCLRHDVDGLLWQPMGDELESWGCLHVSTIQALGYIQASKEQRKFTVCPPGTFIKYLSTTNKVIVLFVLQMYRMQPFATVSTIFTFTVNQEDRQQVLI